MDFSLFFFAADTPESPTGVAEPSPAKYRLLLEAARFADRHGFKAVWTPERHFHSFGGLYPNPSVTSAALATITETLELRAGSVVLPLHNPIRVAEEWSVVDNLSGGRVGLAFASGWHADDFVFNPEAYEDRKKVMADGIETVRALWRGETVKAVGGSGKAVEVGILPLPVQKELPVWITAAGSPATFEEAGRIGANILTHLLGQTFDEVAEKIRAYRRARREAGHDPATGVVTLMLHTFVGEDLEEVRRTVRKPFTDYLRSSVGLIRNLVRSQNLPLDLDAMSAKDMDDLLAFAFDRYFETSALFGDQETCLRTLTRLEDLDVDEVGCLVDFGVAEDAALESLQLLAALKESLARQESRRAFSVVKQAARYQPTLFQCTPSTMSLLALDPRVTTSLASLRALLLGGEALPPALAGQIREALDARLINVYGPTETTIWSSSHEVQEVGAMLPIGRPIVNTVLYVVDEHGSPAPLGTPGELLIGGAGLARGYRGRPALTAEHFVPDPFAGEPGSRLYRTGDGARYRGDGELEFLGRKDQQVKVRGFRVELGEIEAALGLHGGLREAAVTAQEVGDGGDRRLVAYVVPKGEPVGVEALRGHLETLLPEYMVPQIFVSLETMPRTANQKIDRRSLPAPELERPELKEAFVAPSSRLEKTVAEIWGEVLGVEKVGVRDNFFDLGGHSLLMAQAHSRLREALGMELELIKLLEHPTVRSLSTFLETQDSKGSFSLEESQGRAQRQLARRQAAHRRRRGAPPEGRS